MSQSGATVRDEMKRIRPDVPVLLFSGVGSHTPILLRCFDSYLMGLDETDWAGVSVNSAPGIGHARSPPQKVSAGRASVASPMASTNEFLAAGLEMPNDQRWHLNV